LRSWRNGRRRPLECRDAHGREDHPDRLYLVGLFFNPEYFLPYIDRVLFRTSPSVKRANSRKKRPAKAFLDSFEFAGLLDAA
jgi:hypothetical protein